jgi:hypothetical protein
MASGATTAAGSSTIVAGRAASSWGAASASRGVASGSGPPGPDPTGPGGDGGLAGAVTDFRVGEDGAGWGPDPPVGESLVGAEDESGKRALAHTEEVRTQKLNGTKKSMSKQLTRGLATPNLLGRLGDPPFPWKTHWSSGGVLPLKAPLAVGMWPTALAAVVVAASLGTAMLAAAVEFVAATKATAPPPTSPAASGVVMVVVDPGSAPLALPSSGAWELTPP